MNNEVVNRHKRRWYDGKTDSESSLNEAIESFNELVDNMLAPSVHRVDYVVPFEWDINNKFQENVVISDVSRQEQVKDQKLLHTKLDSKLDSGSYIWWDNAEWILLNEEHNAVQDHRTFTINRCAVDINIALDGTTYTFPIAINNLTLYSDGKKELVDMDVSSAKYSVEISENDVANTIDVGTRFIIRGRAFEASLVDDFTIKNVRTITICETVTNTFDDVESDIAYNDNSEIEDIINPNLKIIGNDVILIGDTTEYTLPKAVNWELEPNKALTIVSNEKGKCKIKCKSDSSFIGNVVKLKAINDFHEVIDEKIIRIGGFF